MVRIGLGLLAAMLSAGVASAQTGRILPERPWVEQTAHGPALNFDILLTNDTAAPVELTELEVAFVDRDGHDIITRRLDGNGSAPSIQTVPDREIASGAQRLVFNPFEYAPPGSEVRSVRVRAKLQTGDDTEKVIDLTAPVRPAMGYGFTAPVAGRILVWDGHDQLSHHRRWDYSLPFLQGLGFVSNAMRYSYDFVPVDAEGRMHTGDGSNNADWFGFGQPVRAPAPGVVVQVRDDRPDNRNFDPSELAEEINLVFGNVVVIDHGDGTFSMLGHVKQDSATVAVGDRVTAGQTVAAIGASGSSLFPHLHYQRVDAADMRGEGVPSTFRGLTLANGRAPANGHVDSGDLFEAR
ncbi:MAG TPA: M23 family metallopeptidase [Brevundimonas sp.]